VSKTSDTPPESPLDTARARRNALTTVEGVPHRKSVPVLLDLLDVLEEPGTVDRGFARYLTGQIESVLAVLGASRRGGSMDERIAAVAVDESTPAL
jgi:hypothetical protein